MYKKVCVILAIAFVIAANQISDAEILGDIVDDLLVKLQATVDTAVSSAHQGLTAEQKKVEETANDVSSVAYAVLESMQNSFQRKINNLKDKAEEDKVNIDDCLGKDYEALGNLPHTAYNKVYNCVRSLVKKVEDSVDKASIKINNNTEVVSKLKIETNACRKSKQAATCLIKVAGEIEDDITTLPDNIENDVRELVRIVEVDFSAINTCGTKAITDCDSQGSVLLGKISSCVANKEHH